MGRRDKHTALGKKALALAKTQAELAKILELSQQSVSAKLVGRTIFTLEDLERISKHYDVPIIYFFGPDYLTAEMARTCEKILQSPPEIHQAMEIAASFPKPFAKLVLNMVRSIRQPVIYYNDEPVEEET